MTEPTITRPARARKTAVAAKVPTVDAPAVPKAEAEKITRFKIELEPTGDTKSYAKFGVPANLKGTVVGSIYAPLGTKRVIIMVVGADDNGDD